MMNYRILFLSYSYSFSTNPLC